MFGLGVLELVLIVALLLLFFGATRIPKIARGLGEGIRNFKGELKEGEGDDEEAGDRPRLPGEGEQGPQ